MKILFLIPPSPDNRRIVRMTDCSFESKAAYLWQPNDYLMISSRLAAGDDAKLIDGTVDRLDEETFFSLLAGERPDMAFFALSSTCWEWDLRLFRRVRSALPDTPLYVIGDVFLEDNYLDYILPDCEGAVYVPYLLDLPRMTAQAHRGNTELPGLRRPGMRDEPDARQPLQVAAGVPRHELFLKDGYVFPFARHFRFTTVTTTWGCPFSCAYCNQCGIPPVTRPLEEIVRELDHISRLGVRELFFADKAFGYPPSAIMELLGVMRNRFAFSWSCYFHPQMYKPELLELMHAAGCHTVIAGFDSADMASLRQYGRHVQPERAEALLDHVNRLKMDICADFIIGLEHEGEEEIRRSIDYALRLPIDFASFNIAAPLPGSGIRKKAAEDGKMVFGQEGYDTLARAGIMVQCKVPPERILELRRGAVRRFYLRPRYLLRRLARTESPEHFRIQMRQMLGLMHKS